MSCKLRPNIAAVAAAGLALTLALSGCSSVDPGLGEAHHYDMAIQTIDPDPVYPEDGAKPGDSGAKAAEATERYRKDAVKPIESQTTTEGGTGSGSGSGPN